MIVKNLALNSYRLIIAYLLLVVLSCGPKIPEEISIQNTFNLTTEIQLKDSIHAKKIEDFYKTGTEGYFEGKDNVSIYYKIFDQQDKTKAILISSGRTEAAIKYKELIYDLYNNGYAVFIHDHRGQGLSGRMVENQQMGHIDSFQFYVDDMKMFYDNYLYPKNYQKLFLVAHSMGGAIGMSYIEQFPNNFHAAAFSSPMLGLKPSICKLANVLVTEEPKFAIGQGAYNDEKNKFKGNTLTGSSLRYDRMIKAFSLEPKAQLGGVSYNWLQRSCQQFEVMFSNLDNIEIPFIIFSADNEKIVDPKSHDKFIDQAKSLGKQCELFKISDAKHELLIEHDQARLETINNTLHFFSNF